MEELKPCPFCGATDCSVEADGPMCFYVSCGSCWASTPRCETPGTAAADWNDRPIEDALRAQLAALQEEKAQVVRELVEKFGAKVSDYYVNIYGVTTIEEVPTLSRILPAEEEDDDYR